MVFQLSNQSQSIVIWSQVGMVSAAKFVSSSLAF